MVGGDVVGIARKAESTLVHVQDRTYKGDFCSIRVEEVDADGKPIEIQIGDAIWWQCGHAYWTPKWVREDSTRKHKAGVEYDIRIRKIGYSH